jgi:ligand-binding sensor domain-containing protein/serine phosphatase RsbU (regulator of sigma subunit)
MRNKLLIFLLVFCSSLLKAQLYNFRSFNGDNGLPQNYIYAISQDKAGMLQISTSDGFVKFGGYKFQNHTVRDSLAENFVITHFQDSRQRTWLGHYQNGISCYENGVFRRIPGSERHGSKVLSFTEDKKGNIWYCVQGQGLYFLNSAGKIITPRQPENLQINSIMADHEGGLLASTDAGLLWIDIDNEKELRVVCSIYELSGKATKFLISDSGSPGTYWTSVPGEGIYGLKREKNCYRVSTRITAELHSSNKNFLCIYSDNSGNLWVSLAGEGLRKILFTDKTREAFSSQKIDASNGLSNLNVQTVFEDYEKNIWLGTIGSGLLQMPFETFNFFRPLSASDIRAITPDKKGNLWLGTRKGLVLYNTGEHKDSLIFSSANGFVDDAVNALFGDEAGILWIGTQSSGIWQLDPKGKLINYSAKHKLQSRNINYITGFRNEHVIVATDEGIYMIAQKSGEIIHLTTVEGLMHNNVNHVYCDRQGRIWFSSHDTPPYFLLDDEFTVLQDIPEMKSYAINSVQEDASGLSWIATEGDGIFSYDGKHTKVFTVENGLLSNFCYGIACRNNEIWVTHKSGLSVIRKSGRVIRHFTKGDGLLFPENNTNATFLDAKSQVWFGTTEGLVRYAAPSDKQYALPAPRLTLQPVKINDRYYEIGKPVSLAYGEHSVRFDFVGVSLTDPSRVNYKYRLFGFDTTWRYTTERYVEYAKLREGKYRFQLMAANKDNVWNALPVSFSFEIAIPFWKQIWFWPLVALLFITATYLIVRGRLNRLQNAKKLLEAKVEEKTEQLREEKLQLMQTKDLLEMKNKDITDSINYAKGIQDALLPAHENIRKNFPDSFIYFRPRNIVSGDFYWFAETPEYYIIAVVDCTGHGIPGAFMSLIGSTLMNEIVNKRNITDPSVILSELHENVVRTLRQDIEGSSSRDGMDVSLCAVNKDKTQLIFSSASRPMYYVRNQELTELNLRTYSIGGYYSHIEKTYPQIRIELQKGDQFYLFSDGYADQFNGLSNKKFSTRRLKELLTNIAGKSPEEQLNALDSSLIDWQGKQDQIDDVTVIGFRI